MKRVNILANRNFVSFFFFYPVLANLGTLKGLGFHCRFFEHWEESFWDADYILVDSKVLGKVVPFDDVLQLLQRKTESGVRVVWLDSSASSGNNHFQVLPYVSAYWKKQLLVDREAYRIPMEGGRPFTDYYIRKYGCEGSETVGGVPLPEGEEEKVSVSWNLGVGPYGFHAQVNNGLRQLPWWLKSRLPLSYGSGFVDPGRDRSRLVSYRGSQSHSGSAVQYQRKVIVDLLSGREIDTAPVPFGPYWQELQDSKIGVSPFGYGEICYRDFEVFFAGAALLKPRMNHLKTYPEFFVEDETYIPLSWDLDDFDRVLDRAASDAEWVREIAQSGQGRMKRFREKEGQEAFCRRLVEKLEQV